MIRTGQLQSSDSRTQHALDARAELPSVVGLTSVEFENKERRPHAAEKYGSRVRVVPHPHHVGDEAND